MIKGTKAEIQEKLKERALAYKQIFDTPQGREVLEDLADFCCAYKTTYSQNKELQFHLEGRREAFLRIANYLELTLTEIYTLHKLKGE